MNCYHEWTHRFQVDDDENSPRLTYWWNVMPCIAVLTSSMVVAILPHGFVPGAGSIWGNAYVIGRVSMSHMDWGKKLHEDACRRKRKDRKRKERNRKSKQEGNKDAATCLQLERQAHSFPFLGCHCRLVLSLWFVRRVNVTMLVRLFQDSPPQLAYLGITTKSSSNRLPRRTGFGVILEIDQLLDNIRGNAAVNLLQSLAGLFIGLVIHGLRRLRSVA